MDAILQIDPAGFDAAMGRIGEALRPDLPGPFQSSLLESLDQLMGWEQARFEEFSFGGGDWPELSPSTKLKRAYKAGWRRGRHKRGEQTALDMAAQMDFPILMDTLRLFTSLKQGQPGNSLIFTQDSAAQATEVPYAMYHQLGGSIPGRPPIRQFVVLPPDEILESVVPTITEGATDSIYEASGA